MGQLCTGIIAVFPVPFGLPADDPCGNRQGNLTESVR